MTAHNHISSKSRIGKWVCYIYNCYINNVFFFVSLSPMFTLRWTIEFCWPHWGWHTQSKQALAELFCMVERPHWLINLYSIETKSLEFAVMLLIKINDFAWNDTERESIIKAATDKYWSRENWKWALSRFK